MSDPQITPEDLQLPDFPAVTPEPVPLQDVPDHTEEVDG